MDSSGPPSSARETSRTGATSSSSSPPSRSSSPASTPNFDQPSSRWCSRTQESLRVPVQPDGQVDRGTTQGIRHFDGDRHRRFRRMQGRGTCFSDPVRSWAICIRAPRRQILPHRSSGATDSRRLPSPPDGRRDGRVRSPRCRAESSRQRHTTVLQTQVLGTRWPSAWAE
jgi:hypothetical protein